MQTHKRSRCCFNLPHAFRCWLVEMSKVDYFIYLHLFSRRLMVLSTLVLAPMMGCCTWSWSNLTLWSLDEIRHKRDTISYLQVFHSLEIIIYILQLHSPMVLSYCHFSFWDHHIKLIVIMYVPLVWSNFYFEWLRYSKWKNAKLVLTSTWKLENHRL